MKNNLQQKTLSGGPGKSGDLVEHKFNAYKLKSNTPFTKNKFNESSNFLYLYK